MAGTGTCFQPENVAAVTSTLRLTEQAQVHLLGDGLLVSTSGSMLPTPRSRAAQLMAADGREVPEPSLHCRLWECEPQDGLQPSNGRLAHQGRCARGAYVYASCVVFKLKI